MTHSTSLPQTANGALQIDLATIQAAADRIRPHIFKTPLLESPRLNDFLGRRLLVKAEALQHTGSFKMRGATNAVWSLDDGVRHVVA
ncbi:MAG: pyridoxal-phosphate dependent enzyme, partial [Alphaproteobacteria bacterium]|nr:pyridoxal-phosphate dependent enzyme [Alphaproteobacteria bacterium]